MDNFALFWLDGTKEIVKGNTIENALTLQGYGNGAISALDTYSEIPDKYGESPEGFLNLYEFKDRKWVRCKIDGNVCKAMDDEGDEYYCILGNDEEEYSLMFYKDDKSKIANKKVNFRPIAKSYASEIEVIENYKGE